jgi:histone deacetylase 6
LHANADFSVDPPHPEDPRRIASIMRALKEAELIYTGPEEDLADILKNSPTKYMYRIAARRAILEEICTVHTLPHYNWVAELSNKSSDELRAMSKALDSGRKSLYVGNYTHEAALIAAGGAIETCKNVVAGTVKNAIAVIRPPGHHAESHEALGFCLFNNVPVAARVCQADFPDLCRKVMILDWDVHHGNGIQNIFYDDPNVLYISLHVYKDGMFYPGAPDDPAVPDGGLGNVGAGPGSGKNVNIPWHSQGMGDGEYLGAFQRIVMPIAQEFDPDLVIIAAGFDAAAGDELGGCFVTPACYAHMTHMLMSLAGGKVAVCLEGGYNLKAISRSAVAVAKTLMGEPPERVGMPPINREALKVLHRVKEAHAPFWECMRPGKINVKEEEEMEGVRLNDVIRAYQHKILRQKYKMVDMHVTRDKLAKALEYQVLITSDFALAKKILVIIHDP